MSDSHKHEQVRSRNEAFTTRTATRIWCEIPSQHNPYIAEQALCHGYDLYELMAKRSFVEVFYLLFRGELPGAAEAQLLEQLMIGLINPGPRHPAARAAMNAAVGKTNPVHILPIAAGVFGGEYLGAGDVEAAMRWLRSQGRRDPGEVGRALLRCEAEGTATEPTLAAPGFGRRHGGIDLLTQGMAERLLRLPGAGPLLRWGNQLVEELVPAGYGWLPGGLAAAVFADLGFQPRAGGALFQLLGAPGLVAHGLELANKPITAMPFVSDENYVIESN